MNNKKPYNAPQLVRVELNHEQAILSVCSTTFGSAMTGTTNKCRSGLCKKAAASGDNAGRAS